MTPHLQDFMQLNYEVTSMFHCLQFPLNTISKEMDAMTKGEAVGSCILIPPIPDPKNYYSRSSLPGAHN